MPFSWCNFKRDGGGGGGDQIIIEIKECILVHESSLSLKVSVNENFSTLLDFVFVGFLAWVGPKFYFGRKRKSESAF